MCVFIIVLLQQKLFVLKNNKQDQGKYHLLAIFLIPGFIVTLFLSNHWIWVLLYLAISILVLRITFKSK